MVNGVAPWAPKSKPPAGLRALGNAEIRARGKWPENQQSRQARTQGQNEHADAGPTQKRNSRRTSGRAAQNMSRKSFPESQFPLATSNKWHI